MPPKTKTAAASEPVVTAFTDHDGSARHEQHPALDGHPDAEVEARSPDGADGNRYVKRYVIPADAYGDGEHYDHGPNAANVVAEARNQGVRPVGDEVTFDAVNDHPDGTSLILTYSMAAIPAVIAG